MGRFVFILLFVISSLSAQMDGLKIAKDLPTAIKQAKEQKKNILLFIYGDFCPYCEKMKKTTLSSKTVIKYLNRNNIFVMENQNSQNLKDSRFKTDLVPMTYILAYENGEVLQEFPGYKSPKMLLGLLSDCVAQ